MCLLKYMENQDFFLVFITEPPPVVPDPETTGKIRAGSPGETGAIREGITWDLKETCGARGDTQVQG